MAAQGKHLVQTLNASICLCRTCRLVDPNQGGAGFSPHRDRQPDDSPATFRPDGSAMYATLWVPLTPATPENSCLYIIPRWGGWLWVVWGESGEVGRRDRCWLCDAEHKQMQKYKHYTLQID